MSVDPGWDAAVTFGASAKTLGAWRGALGEGARLAEWQVAAMARNVTPAKAATLGRPERRALVAGVRRAARRAVREQRRLAP
jgi:hypothetical protein